VTLNLPKTLWEDAHRQVNFYRLKFYEERDNCFGGADSLPEIFVDGTGAVRYEVSWIANERIHKGQAELWVEWKGYDQSQNCCVHRDVLTNDVPEFVKASMHDRRHLRRARQRRNVLLRVTRPKEWFLRKCDAAVASML